MKKNLKLSIFFTAMVLIVSCFLSIVNVNAAYAYSWEVDGERLSVGTSNKSSTASWVSDNDYTGGVLELNNYNGGQLKIDCYGTSLGHVFAIKLTGDNTITVENGVGIIANVPVIFIGDGKLIIKAAVPIGSGYVLNDDNYTMTEIEKKTLHGSTTITIESSEYNTNNESNIIDQKDEEENEVPILDENNNSDTNDEDNDNGTQTKGTNKFFSNSVINIYVILYCVISLIVIVILAIKLKRKNS